MHLGNIFCYANQGKKSHINQKIQSSTTDWKGWEPLHSPQDIRIYHYSFNMYKLIVTLSTVLLEKLAKCLLLTFLNLSVHKEIGQPCMVRTALGICGNHGRKPHLPRDAVQDGIFVVMTMNLYIFVFVGNWLFTVTLLCIIYAFKKQYRFYYRETILPCKILLIFIY